MDTHERELIELMMMIDVPIVWEHDENDSSHDVAAFLRNSQFISGRAQRLARTAGVLARQKKTIGPFCAAVARQRSAPARLQTIDFIDVKDFIVKQEKIVEEETCPICCESAAELIVPEAYGPAGGACGCVACRACVSRWVRDQLVHSRRAKALRVQCFGCPKMLPQAIVLEVPEAAALADALERRYTLERNPLFPAPQQVNCRQPECVGIGYLGYETVMCFLCEDQFSMDEAAAFDDPTKFELDGDRIRPCPNCKTPIMKDGGCDHMTCRHAKGGCGHEWWWSTGKPLR